MTLRRLVVFALVLAPLCAEADPQPDLDAHMATAAAAYAEQAVSSALVREDAALQRAVDREIDARVEAVLAPRLPVRLPRAAVAARPATQADPSRPLYAVK